MNTRNPFRSKARILLLVVVGPLVCVYTGLGLMKYTELGSYIDKPGIGWVKDEYRPFWGADR
jgi:hypothetical protein